MLSRCKAPHRLSRQTVSHRIHQSPGSFVSKCSYRARSRLSRLGPGSDHSTHGRTIGATPAVPNADSGRNSEDTSRLVQRAASIARKLIQQREEAVDVQATKSRPALDQSLTSLLTPLLKTLADADTFAALVPNSSTDNASRECTTPSTNDLLQLLIQWADEFITSDSITSSPTKRQAKVPPSNPDDDAASAAKSLFMQLLAELLPPTQTSTPPGHTSAQPAAAGPPGPPSPEPSVGRGLLAATAAAFTAREAASRLQQHWKGDNGPPADQESWTHPTCAASCSTDDFDPNAWEAVAKAAAEAAQADGSAATTPGSAAAAAAVATNTEEFSPDAWEAAAAAAAAAAMVDPEDAGMRLQPTVVSSTAKPPLPEPCWAVKTLAAALQSAAQAAVLRGQPSARPVDDISQALTVHELLLPPAPTAVQQLLELPSAERAALLLLLCGAPAPTELTVGAGGPDGRLGFGSRGDAWLLLVLEGVAPHLGLLEMGVCLTALHDRYGEEVFYQAAATLLPLCDATEPSLSLTSSATPTPPAALQALLLHWLLQPQLAAAGLPLLPEAVLLRLLPQVVSASSLTHLAQATHWGSVWPLTQLQPVEADQGTPAAAEVGSSDNTFSSNWQVHEPQLDMAVQTQAWCGLTGVPLVWVAHVAAAAAAKLIHGTSSTSYSSSSHSGQLSEGAAAAMSDNRAVLAALLRGLQPHEPLVLLLLRQVQLLQPDLAGMASSSAAAEGRWKQQLLQLLLDAYSGTTLPAASLADCIHRSLCYMWRAQSGDNQSISMHQQQVLDAAAAVLVALPSGWLQQELQGLFSLEATDTASRAGRQHTEALGSMLAAAAQAADPAQAAAMLASLSMPHWVDVWAVFVSPVAGSFCWSRQQLAVTLQRTISATAAAGRGSSSSSSSMHVGHSWQKLKAAWEVVVAHFNLQEVVQEVSRRTVPVSSAGSTASKASAKQHQAISSKLFDVSQRYQYKPGVPFVGDGWDQAEDDVTSAQLPAGLTGFSGSLGVFVAEVLSSAPPSVVAAHIAVLVEVLPAQAFAGVAAVLVPMLVDAVYTRLTPQGSPHRPKYSWPHYTTEQEDRDTPTTSADLHKLAKVLANLYSSLPELPEAPLAMQLLATAAPALPLDRVPALITAAGSLAPKLKAMPWAPGAHSHSISDDSSPELSATQQLELVVAAAASGRDHVALQHMLAMLVRQLPLKEAHMAFRVLQNLSTISPHQQLTHAAIEEASSILRQRCDAAGAARRGQDRSGASADEDDMVWQLGQSSAAMDTPAAMRQALGSFVQDWSSTAAPSGGNSSGVTGGDVYDVYEADRALMRQLSDVINDIPHAPPEGSWPMDAMHSPSYTAPLLKRCLALLVEWTPSCPSAAATAAQVLGTLASKRRWTAAEASAFLQRMPLMTALQLLLEASSSSSSSGSKRGRLVQLRPKLLRALADWQGCEAVVQGLRELLVVYDGQGITNFAEMMSDLKLVLCDPVVTSAAAGSRQHGTAAPPNAYVAAVLDVFGVLLPGTSSVGPGSSWSQQLAQVLAQVSLKVPEAACVKLAEQVARSFTPTHQKPTQVSTAAAGSPAAAAAAAAWQADTAAFLAALPAAAAEAGVAQGDWVVVASAVIAAVAEAAGSTAVLQCLRATLQAASLPAMPKASWAAALPAVLGHVQQQGLLTCGVAYATLPGASTGGSSSMDTRFSSRPGPITPSCISLQLMGLLQDLYLTDHSINLQQAAAAVVAVQDSLGKALPLAVACVLGGRLRGAKGYGTSGPDAAEAVAALEVATADVSSRFQPTAAALPAATAAAALQLSEALARCHELLPEQLMAALMTALAAVLPWTDSSAAAAAAASEGAGASSSSSSSSSSTRTTCPAEVELSQGGWCGVTQVLLVTSTLLKASCKVWGVDKGTQVAASLIQKLLTPVVPPEDAGEDVAVDLTAATPGPSRSLRRSKSAGELQAQQHANSSSNSSSIKRSASTGALVQGIKNSKSQAGRAEEALLAAVKSGSSSSQSGRAGTKLHVAAGTGGKAAPGSHASKASAALLKASASNSGPVGAHASRAEAKLLHAAVETGADAAPGTHAAKAKAALLQAAASGLAGPTVDGTTHAQQAHEALVQALATGHSSSHGNSESAEDAEMAACGTQQLLAAADAWLWPGLSTPKALVRGILYPKYHSVSAEGTSSSGAGAGSDSTVLSPCEAAAALVASLPRLASELPAGLAAEVLAQTCGLIPSASWTRCLQRTAAAYAEMPPPGIEPGTAAAGQLLQLLQCTAASLQQQLEACSALPAAYAEVLVVGASRLPEADVHRLLQQMVASQEASDNTEGLSHNDQAQGLSPQGFAQLLLELSRPAAPVSSATSSRDDAARDQLSLVEAAASLVLLHTSSDSSMSPADVAAALGGRLYQADLLPRAYLTLLLLPHLSAPQQEVAVKQLGLTSNNAPAALTALSDLCHTLNPGRQVSLGFYAQVLTTALEATLSADFSKVTFPEARQGLELERQQTLQQLLAGVVQVLGTFRGMRKLHTSPLGAQLLLPMHDLAAVLCFSWQLLPAADATGLATAVAAAFERLRGERLVTVLQLLPAAAAEGFSKGPELWQPLLHVMAVAGGLSEAQESSITRTLLSVRPQQGVPSHPLVLELSDEQQGHEEEAVAQFADPAAVRSALSAAAANNQVGLSAGRLCSSSSTSAGGAAGAQHPEGAAAAIAAAVVEDDSDADTGCRKPELSGADAALAAGVIAALLVFTPMAVLLGPAESLPVAIGAALGATLGAARRRSNSSGEVPQQTAEGQKHVLGTAVSDEANSSSSSSSSQPPSPRTPTTTDTPSGRVLTRHAAMGGRTKVEFRNAVDVVAGPAGAERPAAALGYGAAATAAAAAAVGKGAGVVGLGSLAVDPDDVIKKIKGQSAQLPLDQALMELVPLLLLPADSSSYTWPLLGLSAILHSKFPRLHALLGPGGAPLTNMVLAATLVNPDGPLAAVMHASELLAEAESSSGSSSSSPARSNLLAALAAAEAVHPHAVAMQLAERLLNALWAVLINNTAPASGSGSDRGDRVTVAGNGSAAATSAATPEGAAAAWQQVVIQLLLGVDRAVAVKLLSGFAHKQQGNWEAQLRVLAVAAALQQQHMLNQDEGGSSETNQQLLPELLAQVCAGNNYPPLSFLTLLLSTDEVQLSSTDTAAVLDTALTQLISNYSTVLPPTSQQQQGAEEAAANRVPSSSSRRSSDSGPWGGVGVNGDFDSWGCDALAGTGGLLGATDLSKQDLQDWAIADMTGSSDSSAPQYRSTSRLFNINSSSSSTDVGAAGEFAPRVKLSAVPPSVISLLQSVIRGACARGHATQALRFVTQVLQMSHNRTALQQDLSAAASAGHVLIVEADQEQQLLQLAVTAVQGCLRQPGMSPAGAAGSTAGVSVLQLQVVLPELLCVLADRGHQDTANQVVAVVCEALAQEYARHSSPGQVSKATAAAATAQLSDGSSSAVTPELVGLVLTSAAQGVRKSEGVLSAARPAGALFLATAADALFAGPDLPVQQCLVLLSAVAPHLPERLGLQLVAAAAGRLHSVMPQAVGIVRQVAVQE